jgi:hypothetical protein
VDLVARKPTDEHGWPASSSSSPDGRVAGTDTDAGRAGTAGRHERRGDDHDEYDKALDGV